MTSDVLCRFCGKTYDLGEVEVIHRYADCTLFKTPCCGRQADDREWKSLPDYTRINRRPQMMGHDGVIYLAG